MSDIRETQKALVHRILEGDGKASLSERRAAFSNSGLNEPMSTLVEKVALHADRITDEDISSVKASARTEDEIFEIIVCAAIGQATRQFDAALAALEAAVGKG